MLRKGNDLRPIDRAGFSREIGGVTPPPRNDIPRSSAEVPRSTEIIAVGDLHGNGQIFVENMKSLKIVAENANFNNPDSIHWTGGNKRIVFHGDILADRGTDSLSIMASLRRLQAEARAAGGEVTILAGNHEDFAISFLTGDSIAGMPGSKDTFSQMVIGGEQGKGLLEFFQKYSNDPRYKNAKTLIEVATIAGFEVVDSPYGKMVVDPNFPAFLEHQRQVIVYNMKNSPEGAELLNQITKFKLAEYIDDSLFLHTDPTPEMMSLILRNGKTIGEAVDNINRKYQQGLRFQLFGEGTMPPDFQEIRNAFLFTNNRTSASGYKGQEVKINRQKTFVPLDLKPLHAMGVNHILHGHTEGEGVVVEKDGIKLSSVDLAAGKKGKNMDKRSIAKIDQQGYLDVGSNVNALERNQFTLHEYGVIEGPVPDRMPVYGYEGANESVYVDRTKDPVLREIIGKLTAIKNNPDVNQQIGQLSQLVLSYTNSPTALAEAAKLSGGIYLGDALKAGAGAPRHRALLFQVLAAECGLNVRMVRGAYNNYQHTWNEVVMPNGAVLIVDTSHVQSNNEPTYFYSGGLNYPYYRDIHGQPLYLNPAAAAANGAQ
jgi:hypothetical protein